MEGYTAIVRGGGGGGTGSTGGGDCQGIHYSCIRLHVSVVFVFDCIALAYISR